MPKKPKYVTKAVSSYDPWISIKKFLIQGALVALVAFLTYFVNTGIPELMLEYPAQIAILSMTTAVIAALINYIKHYRDTIMAKVNSKTGEIVEYIK